MVSGAPAMLFDCVFTGPPEGSPPVRLPKAGQRLIVSGNRVEDAEGVFPPEHQARLYSVPAGDRAGSIQSAHQRFLRDTADIPVEVLDARQDFGAMGDGKTAAMSMHKYLMNGKD